jgi:octaprenyl-diphosphate synthase
VGDYLLSKGLLLALEHNDYGLLKIVSEATREMSEGELLQIEKARRLDIKEDVYFEIIRKKTASLIASCCAAGAASSGADEDTVNYLKLFGEKVGIAFQIKDDLFDYQKTTITGKPSGIDIKEQKMTLPLIYLLNNSSTSEKNKIINTVKRYHDDTKRVNALIKQVNESGGIEYAKQKMLQYRSEAIKMLDKLPDSPSKTSLAQLVVYTTERNK